MLCQSKTCQVVHAKYTKVHVKWLVIGEWPSKYALLLSYVTSCQWPVITTSISCTISEILSLLQCTWLPATLKSFTFHNKVEITSHMCSPFMCKHVVVRMHYNSWVMGIRIASNNKSDLHLTQDHCYLYHSTDVDFLLVFYCNHFWDGHVTPQWQLRSRCHPRTIT